MLAGDRDHLFVSYATEDGLIAEWLALRLTAEGYKVWIDRFELLGGEPYPKHIDQAIKERTCRVLALVSRHSIGKDNPRKEWTIALNVGRSRGCEDFLIPLNVTAVKPEDLPTFISDLTFIPFDRWEKGLDQLLLKLRKIEAPRSAESRGRDIAARVSSERLDLFTQSAEPLYANLLEFERVPNVVHCHRPPRSLSKAEREALLDEWAFWALPPSPEGDRSCYLYFSFTPPPEHSVIGHVSWVTQETVSWRDVRTVGGINPEHVVKPLLRRAIVHHLRRKGLEPADNPDVVFFPPGLIPNDSIVFVSYDGKLHRRSVVGERSYGSDRFRYHMGVTFDVLRDLSPRFVAKFRIRLHITDLEGNPMKPLEANARRKAVTRSWWNEEWLERHMALCSFLADKDVRIVIGEDDDPIVLSGSLVQLQAPYGIDEEALPKGTPLFVRMRREEDEADGDEE